MNNQTGKGLPQALATSTMGLGRTTRCHRRRSTSSSGSAAATRVDGAGVSQCMEGLPAVAPGDVCAQISRHYYSVTRPCVAGELTQIRTATDGTDSALCAGNGGG